MKIAFLFKRDSHFKAVKSTALRVCGQYNCEPVFIGMDSEFSPSNESYSITYIDKYDLSCLSKYDYVITCLGGYLLNQVVSALRDTDTKVISIFPGIVSHYQLDAFISRLNADQVWLNSKADFELYNKICKLFKHPNNSILYGMSWLNPKSYTKKHNSILKCEEAVFFEQTEILSNAEKKQRYTHVIEKIVVLNPKVKFKYKIRNNSTDKYFLFLRSYLNKFENLNVIEELTENDILNAKYYLSISSSAIIEGIVNGKESYIIDMNLLDIDGNEFYRNSGIQLKNFILDKNCKSENKKWCKDRIFIPNVTVNLLNVKKINKYINARNRSNYYIFLIILKVSVQNPKIFNLIFKIERIRSIKKSLEYISNNQTTLI